MDKVCIQKPHKQVPIILALAISCLVILGKQVKATIVVIAHCKSRYFEVQREVNVGGPDAELVLQENLKTCLQLHRAIAASPRLARQFSRHPVKLGGPQSLPSLNQQLHKLGFAQKQIRKQSGYIYTLHILSYRNKKTLHWFVNRWLHHHMNRRRLYASVPKTFQLSVEEADVVVKHDPLYVQMKVGKKHELSRLCYGVYENRVDAYRDRRSLQKQLGCPVQVLREQLTPQLMDRIWFKSVMGDWPADWEAGR